MTLWDELRAGADGRPLHATLIDPASTAPTDAAKLGEALARAGTDLFLVGGSTDVTGELVQTTVDALKETSDLPVLLFPSSHTQVATNLDGILYTVTFNSTSQEVIIEEPARGALPLVRAGIEAVTTAYVIVEPGMTVGRVARAELVPRSPTGVERVRRYAHLARVLRFDAVYLEAGSGAPHAVPPELVRAANEAGVPVIAGGGIRTPEQATAAARAGAAMVVTGTIAERGEHEAVRAIVAALRSAH